MLKDKIVRINAAKATNALKEFIHSGLALRANSVKIVLAYEKQSVAERAKYNGFILSNIIEIYHF